MTHPRTTLRRVATLALFFVGASPLTAEQPAAQKLSLEECVRLAMERQPALQARAAGVGVATEQQKVARSYFFPQATFSAQLTQLDQHVFVAFPGLTGATADVFADAAAFFGLARQFGPGVANLALTQPNQPPFATARQAALTALPRNFQADLLGERALTTDLTVTQPLYTGGKVRYRNEQAKVGIQAAVTDVDQAKNTIAFEVTRAYYGVLLARELERVAGSATAKYGSLEELIQSCVKEGVEYVSTADEHRARTLRVLSESHQTQARRAADQALAGLRAAMGLSQEEKVDVADARLSFEPMTLERAGLIERALARRPEMVKARLAVEAAELERKVAQAQFSPDVAAFGRFSTVNDNRDYPNPTNPYQAAVGLQASIPLSTGGRRLAEKRRADHLVAQAIAARDLARTQVEREVEEAYLEYQEMAERLPLTQKAVREGEQALHVLEEEYSLGIKRSELPRHFDNRMSTRLLLTQAQAAYHQQVFAYLISLAKVRLATGSP